MPEAVTPATKPRAVWFLAPEKGPSDAWSVANLPGSPVVFVVDDDVAVREGLDGLLSSLGWLVETFSSAREFLETEPSAAPSCLILDVGLPDVSGIELQQTLAAVGRPIPIIFITGHGDIPMSVRAMKAGAVEFLTKPFFEEELIAAIEQALARDRSGLAHRAELRTPVHDIQN